MIESFDRMIDLLAYIRAGLGDDWSVIGRAVRMRQVLGWSGATSVAITEGQRARICSRLSWDS